MGYMHLVNLYRDARILDLKKVWALEKIDGTSAHIRWSNGKVSLFSGGSKMANFEKLFDMGLYLFNPPPIVAIQITPLLSSISCVMLSDDIES